eukprot:g24804.t1
MSISKIADATDSIVVMEIACFDRLVCVYKTFSWMASAMMVMMTEVTPERRPSQWRFGSALGDHARLVAAFDRVAPRRAASVGARAGEFWVLVNQETGLQSPQRCVKPTRHAQYDQTLVGCL